MITAIPARTSTESIVKPITELCKKGLFLDALDSAQTAWGPIDTWSEKEQLLIAVRIYAHLGSDRKSDAILLRLWRKDKTQTDVLYRMLFYKLMTLGPILAQEFLQQHQQILAQDSELKSNILAFKSIIQQRFKNYTKAEQLLDEGISIDPDNSWLTSLKIQVLSEQEQVDEQHQAQSQTAGQLLAQHFSANPSPYNLRTLSYITQKQKGLEASIALYEQQAPRFQSADIWFELASMQATRQDWAKCEYAVQQYLAIRITTDKSEEQQLLALQGQIAIHYQNIDKAIRLLKQHKGYYWQTVTENLIKSQGSFERKILDVPFLRQEHFTCAPTTLAAISQYWGIAHSSKEIADKICFDGTPDTLERQWLRDNDFAFIEFDLATELAYQLIDRGIPFALVTTQGFSSHLQAVIGYNKQVGTIYTMDPSSSSMQEMLTKEAIEAEAYTGARCLAFAPKDKADLLTGFDFPSRDFYPLCDQYNRARDNNDPAAAQQVLQQLNDRDPDHRITLQLNRNYAAWNNDIQAILALNDQLLAHFPQETVLHNSRYFCLRDLGKRDSGLTALNEYVSNNSNLDLLTTLFDEIYDTNEDPELVASTLLRLKEIGCNSARTYWSIANYYWSSQQYELATDYYLTAHCMEETNNQYVESYFKASRFLKTQDLALDFLKNRFDKYKVRSPMPAISLFKAYELLDLEHIGFDYLFKALALHPLDTELIMFLAKELIHNSLFDKFDDLQAAMTKALSKDDLAELVAKKNAKQGNTTQALAYYQGMFTNSPFVYKYADNYFGLLNRLGNTATLDSTLEQLHEQHPDNVLVLNYIADWHSSDTYQEKALVSLVAVRADNGSARRQYTNVLNRLGKFAEALAFAKQTCARIKGEIINTAYLARCYLNNGNYEKAKLTAQQALSLSVDNDYAFNTLMEASISKDESIQALEFVFTQIQQQVIFGDSAFNFWFKAKSLFSHDKLQAFVDYLLLNQEHLWHSYSVASMFYMQNNELEKAKEVLIEAKNKFPLTPRIHFDLGHVFEAEGDINNAITAYRAALEQSPGWAAVAKQLSEILDKHGETGKAAETLERTLKHNNDDGILHGYLAHLRITQGQQEQALTSLTKAVEKDPDYRWAWNNISTISAALGKPNFAYDLAKQFTEQTPHKAATWHNLAYVTEDNSQKRALLTQALACNPRYVPAYEDMVQLDIDKGDFQQAILTLSDTPWGQHLPIDLATLKAELLAETGQVQEATIYLKSILVNIQGYEYLWSKLYRWLKYLGDKDEYFNCSQLQVAQNPHDPGALCMAGENLVEHDDIKIKRQADDYLKRAYALAPNNQYITLTYIDRLIDKEEFAQANTVIEAYEKVENIGRIITRKIFVLCQLKQYQQALEMFKCLISDGESDYWTLNYAYEALRNEYSLIHLLNLFSDDLNVLTRMQAFFWADKHCFNTKSTDYKTVLAELKNITNAAAYHGSLQAVLEYWNEKEIVPPKQIIDKHYSKLIADPELASILGYAYIMNDHYYSVIDLLSKVKDKAALPACSFYHHYLSLQMLGRRDEASPFVMQGLEQQPDNALHNLKLWYAFELYSNNKRISKSDLDVIDYEALIDIERYIYSILEVVTELGEYRLENKLVRLSPLLRRCQQNYQQAIGATPALYAKKLLRATLKNAISVTGFFERIKLHWWISNRF